MTCIELPLYMNMNKLLIILLTMVLTLSAAAREWVFHVHPDSLRFISTTGSMERPKWFMDKYGLRNLVNLSFFTKYNYIPPYKDSFISVLKNPRNWPHFHIGDSCYVECGNCPIDSNSKFIVSGYPILVQDSSLYTFKRSFFTRRICPRTTLGVGQDGMIIIYVTTAANLKTLQKKMLELGCVDAINLDGGSSTFLYLDGKPQTESRQGRTYPNILTW